MLTPLLALVPSEATSLVDYVLGGQELSEVDRELATQMIADEAMSVACGAANALQAWRQRRDGGAPHSPVAKATVATYVGIAFGSPQKPPEDDHLQGHVAELLWNLIVRERITCKDGRRLVHAHSVKADPLEPGGDGLVIYEDTAGTLVFRLWEIKKHDAQARISTTINRASNQLLERGHEYLAKLAGPATLENTGALGDLYAEMVELWFDRSLRAGVGVAIGTSDSHAPKSTAFLSIRRKFPRFTLSSQTEGIVVAIPEFPEFANRVKEIMWSGL